jgi:hypothetical protein
MTYVSPTVSAHPPSAAASSIAAPSLIRIRVKPSNHPCACDRSFSRMKGARVMVSGRLRDARETDGTHLRVKAQGDRRRARVIVLQRGSGPHGSCCATFSAGLGAAPSLSSSSAVRRSMDATISSRRPISSHTAGSSSTPALASRPG